MADQVPLRFSVLRSRIIRSLQGDAVTGSFPKGFLPACLVLKGYVVGLNLVVRRKERRLNALCDAVLIPLAIFRDPSSLDPFASAPWPLPCLPQSRRELSWGFLHGEQTQQDHTVLSPTQKNIYS